MLDYQAEFLRRVVPAVLALQERTGLPASVVLAQAILESDWGRSALARRNHNLFGIKAPARRNTPAVAYFTCEYIGGKPRRQRARFARYRDFAECLDDYARLLSRPRFAPAQAVASNPEAFARALQRCGYATDPRYAHKLGVLARRYDLHQFDAEAPPAAAEAPATQLAKTDSSHPQESTP